MNEIIVAIISACASLFGILITSRITQNKMTNELDKAVALLQNENKRMSDDIKEHNHYAKLFAESMPVVQEKIKVINHRLENLEKKVG